MLINMILAEPLLQWSPISPRECLSVTFQPGPSFQTQISDSPLSSLSNTNLQHKPRTANSLRQFPLTGPWPCCKPILHPFKPLTVNTTHQFFTRLGLVCGIKDHALLALTRTVPLVVRPAVECSNRGIKVWANSVYRFPAGA